LYLGSFVTLSCLYAETSGILWLQAERKKAILAIVKILKKYIK
jgi:hypothetical protein